MNQNSYETSLLDSLPILKYGNPILRKKTRMIENFTIIPRIVEKMIKTMNLKHGIGLAANQIGFSINLMIIDTSSYENEKGKSHLFINSEIVKTEGETIMEEGCLSIPNIHAEIKRAEKITLKYQDINKKFHERNFTGITSRAIQHEVDHLNGKLFIDYLTQTKRILINKRLLEISKSGKLKSGIIL